MQLRAADTAGFTYAPNVLADIPRGALVLLRDPRRVGKSVELKRFAASTLASGATPLSGVSGWHAEIKNLRDNDAQFARDTVVLTGSSARDLTNATSSLAGRRGEVARPDRTLLPMGFRIFADIMLRAYSRSTPGTRA